MKRTTLLLIGLIMVTYAQAAHSQGRLRQLIQQQIGTQGAGNTGSDSPNGADFTPLDGASRQNIFSQSGVRKSAAEKETIAGVHVAIWNPVDTPSPVPLLIFSHGFHGGAEQSVFLMKALQKAGYLVIAPNHHDALGEHGQLQVAVPFQKAQLWNDTVYADRRDDIVGVVDALHKDPKWSKRIDWSKVALSGHSLGGYTALALGGAWTGWKLPGVKAIVALSPYCMPFLLNTSLSHLGVPVMYQGGTKDRGITPFVKGPNGAYSKTAGPAEYVEFDEVGHFDWTNLGHNQQQQDLISQYVISFLNKYVKGDETATPEKKLPGVTELLVK